MDSHVRANDYRVKMGSMTKTYHVNMFKNNFPETLTSR